MFSVPVCAVLFCGLPEGSSSKTQGVVQGDQLSERGAHKEKGLGDTQDENVYTSHITPRQQERIAKLVGRKCSVQCYLDDKPLEVL